MAERLGIVYTPVEVVDFIIHSVEDVLQREFERSLGDKDVHVIDPFTGTGTFIVRLLQSGLIKPADLLRKYQHELHANEIILLAYYIAAINIEDILWFSFRRVKTTTTTTFEGIVPDRHLPTRRIRSIPDRRHLPRKLRPREATESQPHPRRDREPAVFGWAGQR